MYFQNLDPSTFYDNDYYALANYVSAPPSNELIHSIEAELGSKLPTAYIALMKIQNGGMPWNNCFPIPNASTNSYISITGILGIGREKTYSLCGELGTQFMIDEWGYPDKGIYICDCPSGGHDMVMLDYSNCGPEGEPEVVHIDQEFDYRKTFLAEDFVSFVSGLVSEKTFYS